MSSATCSITPRFGPSLPQTSRTESLLRSPPSAMRARVRSVHRRAWWRDHFDDLARLNVAAAEMEASVIFVLARVWGLRAGGMAVVLDNVRRVSGTSGEFMPEKQIEHGAEHIERLARLGCETVRHLALRDQEAAPARAGLDAGDVGRGSGGVDQA